MSGKQSKKREFPFQDEYEDRFGLRITTTDKVTKKVNSSICRFCESFGRENNDAGSSQVQSTIRKRTINAHHFTNVFRPDNIQRHLQQQHPVK